MTTLKIKNIGPIKEVFFELKRFNFFIGRQSSGKSTIAKIISFCTWVEKDIQTFEFIVQKYKEILYLCIVFRDNVWK